MSLTSLERPEDSLTVWIQLHEGRCHAVNVDLRDPLTMNLAYGYGVPYQRHRSTMPRFRRFSALKLLSDVAELAGRVRRRRSILIASGTISWAARSMRAAMSTASAKFCGLLPRHST